MLSESTIDLLTNGVGQLATSIKTIHRAMKSISSKPEEVEPEEEEEEAKKALRFECKPCGYQSNHKGDFGKHCETFKHKREVENEKVNNKDPFDKLRKRYPVELKDETRIHFLTALAYLEPLRMGSSGKQGMCCQPLSYLWDAIHKHMFGGHYYMTASKHQIFNMVLPRSKYCFDIFEKMHDAALMVHGEADEIIEKRGRHLKYWHNTQNWKAYDTALACIPRYAKDRRPEQKRIHTQSLHEYLMTQR